MVFAEEGDYISQEMWLEVMAPLLLVAGTALIAISTIRKNTNGMQSMYSYMMHLKDPIFKDQGLFKLIHVRTTCDSCAKARKERCPHMQIAPVSWKDPENAARVKALMSIDASAMMAEVTGVAVGSNVALFNAMSIARLKDRTPYVCNLPEQGVLFLVVDPSGGGIKSDYAIMTLFYHRGNAVIVGLDTYTGDDHTRVEHMLREHYKGLRAQPRFRNSVIVLLPEGNMSFFTPRRIYEQFYGFEMIQFERKPNIVLYAYDQHKKPMGGVTHTGTLTTGAMKQTSMHMVRAMLDAGCIHFDSCIVSMDPVGNKQKLLRQLANFHMELREPKDHVTQETKSYLTGKAADGSSKDDMVMTLLMGVFWARQSVNNTLVTTFVQQRHQQFPEVVANYTPLPKEDEQKAMKRRRVQF